MASKKTGLISNKNSKVRKEAKAQIRSFLSQGYDYTEILAVTSFSPTVLTGLLTELADDARIMVEEFNNVDAYCDYLRRMSYLIREHHRARRKFKANNQAGPIVQSLKAEKEICDSIITHGQSLGFLEKIGSNVNINKNVNNKISFSADAPKQITEKIKKQKKEIEDLSKEDVDIIEMRPELIEEAGLEEGIETFIPNIKKKSKSKSRIKKNTKKKRIKKKRA